MQKPMNKTKVYLDTSVISYLEQTDAPEQMQITRNVWETLKSGKYDIYISDVTVKELSNCKDENKRKLLLGHLTEIKYNVVDLDEKTVEFSEKIVDFGILKKRSFDDCRHIAAAVVSNCDFIMSWRFTRIINFESIEKLKVLTTMEGYKEILIYSPESFQTDDNEETSEATTNITELKEPELSPRFDVEDIRKLREYNSLRHINMTAEEIIAELEADTAEIIAELRKNGNILN